MQHCQKPVTFLTKENIKKGLKNTFWPGRGQIINYKNKKFYLDGAHTPESMECCSKWFEETVDKKRQR